MGFGLFVPEFRSEFGMSSSTLGFVSSLGFLGFFIGLWIAQVLLNRRGPEQPVLAGLLAATLGLTLVALAPNLAALAAGVFLAASSAGFAWTPFNDAVHRKIRDDDRPAALSQISTGTSVGIALAGLVALAMVLLGLDWRVCWMIFAAASAIVLVANRVALHPVGKAPDMVSEGAWRGLMNRAALPLFAVAFIYGTTSAIYISFAADRFSSSGGVAGVPAAAAPAVIFIVYGLFGLTGFLTDRMRGALGLPWLLRGLMLTGAVSMASVALWAGSWVALLSSAAFQGVNVMMTSAVLAFWSERLFPTLPSLSFTTALLATAAGSVIGPAVAGVASDVFGPEAMFLAAAVLPLAAAALLRARHVQERAVAMGDCAPA